MKNANVIWPKREDYAKVFALASKLRKAGKPVGAADIIIASICINRSLALVSKDEDFKVIREIDPSLKLKLR